MSNDPEPQETQSGLPPGGTNTAYKTKAEEVAEHGLTDGATSATDLVRNSPFLIVSVLLHVAVLVLLACVQFREPIVRATRAIVNLDTEVEIPEEVRPLRKEINLFAERTDSLSVGTIATESLEAAAAGTSAAEIEKLSILGLSAATAAGEVGEFEGYGTDFNIVPARRAEDIEGAVDQFAVVTLNAMSRGRTLVVILVDRSASVLYQDLPRVIKRMDHYFDEIDKNIPPGAEKNGRWVIASYGKSCSIQSEPSGDLNRLKAALRSVVSDPSGVENIGGALATVLDRYGGKGYKYMLVAAITDEAGDDIVNPKVLEQTISRLRKAKARFFVFGYESRFSARKKRVSFPATQLKGKDLAIYKAYAAALKTDIGKLSVSGWADGGPECPRPELWWNANRHSWGYWGGGVHGIPAGFGMYGLNRLVLASDGIYFLLKPESKYDDDKLYAQYKPDMCSIIDYEKRMAAIPLRRELRQVWREMGLLYLGNHLNSPKAVANAVAKARNGREYCIKHAAQLQRLVDHSKPTGHNWQRWEAHADLTMAELMRFRFMLGQYEKAVRAYFSQIKKQIPERHYIAVGRGRAPNDFLGGEAAHKEYKLAQQLIERVTNKHKATPWEVLGKRLYAGLYPWKCSLHKYPPPPKPRKPGDPPRKPTPKPAYSITP